MPAAGTVFAYGEGHNYTVPHTTHPIYLMWGFCCCFAPLRRVTLEDPGAPAGPRVPSKRFDARMSPAHARLAHLASHMGGSSMGGVGPDGSVALDIPAVEGHWHVSAEEFAAGADEFGVFGQYGQINVGSGSRTRLRFSFVRPDSMDEVQQGMESISFRYSRGSVLEE